MRERGQSSRARSGDRNAEAAQPPRQMRGVHRLTGLLAGKQPAVLRAGGHHLGDWAQRCGQRSGLVAKANRREILANGEVVDGQSDDPRDGLGVERDQASGQTQPWLDRLLVQQAVNRGQALVVVDGDVRGGSWRCGYSQASGLPALKPGDERSDRPPGARCALGQPLLEAGLVEFGECQAALVQPADQVDGRDDVAAGHRAGQRRGTMVATSTASRELAADLPDREHPQRRRVWAGPTSASRPDS